MHATPEDAPGPHRLIADAWAHAHDLAVARHGEDAACRFTTGPTGGAFVAALEAAAHAPGAGPADLLAVVERFVPDPDAPAAEAAGAPDAE